MLIRIVSKRDGFRRCGIPHPSKPTTYPGDRFSDEELKILKAEPMLVVTKISKQDAEAQTEGDEKEPKKLKDETTKKSQDKSGDTSAKDSIDYSKLDYWKLKGLCKERDLSTSGNKEALIKRLKEAQTKAKEE